MKRLLLLFLVAVLLLGQEDAKRLTLEKYPILVLPSDHDDHYETIASKLTDILGSKATELKRFNVIDRTQLESILNEQSIQMTGLIDDNQISEAGKIAAAQEALVLHVINFGQKGVPPESEEEDEEKDDKEARKSGLLGIIAKEVVDAAIDKAMEDVERYPNNIQTVIRANVRKLDIESGKSLESFSINIIHTGGNKEKSLNRALAHAESRISAELRKLYLLTSEILEVQGNEIMMLLGQDMGLSPGMTFDIVSPEYTKTIREREVTIPGRSVGIVTIDDVSGDASRGHVLRMWDDIEPGYNAVEYLSPVFGANVFMALLPQNGVYRLGAGLSPNPFQRFIADAEFSIGTIVDTYDDTDFTFGIGGKFGWKVIHAPMQSIGVTLSLPVHFAMRSDDESNSVVLPIFSPGIGVSGLIQVNKSRDLYIGVNYVFTSTTGSWKFSETNDDDETDSFPAVWDDGEGPNIDPAGLYLQLGFRFLTL